MNSSVGSFTNTLPRILVFEPPAGIDGGFQRVDSFSPGDSVLIYVLVDDFEPYLSRLWDRDWLPLWQGIGRA